MLQVSWNATSQLTQKKFKKEMTFYVSLEWSYSEYFKIFCPIDLRSNQKQRKHLIYSVAGEPREGVHQDL